MDRFSGKSFWYAFSAILTILFLALAFWVTDLSVVSSVFESLGIQGVLAATVVYVGGIALRTARFSILLGGGFWPNFRPLFGVVCIHQFYNHLLPARLGELSFPILLKKRMNKDAFDSAGFLLIARFYDAVSLGIVVLLGIVFYALLPRAPGLDDVPYSQIVLGSIALLLIICLLYTLFMNIDFSRFVFVSKKTKLGQLLDKLVTMVEKTRDAMRRQYGFRSNFIVFALSLSIWITLSFFFYVIFRGSGLFLSFSEVVVGSSLSHLTQFLPVNTFGSFGSLEAGWTVGFSLIGIEVDIALGVGIAMHLLTIVVLTVLGFLSLVFGKPNANLTGNEAKRP